MCVQSTLPRLPLEQRRHAHLAADHDVVRRRHPLVRERVHLESYAATGAPTYTSSGSRIRNPSAYTGAIEASYRQNTSTPKYLYHYTDPSSASAIASSGKLKRSTGRGDCALGEGVYFTAKPPKSKSSALLNNNYGGASSLLGESKVSAYVRIEADSVNYHNGRRDLGRDVFVVHGDVDLRQSGAKLGQRH